MTARGVTLMVALTALVGCAGSTTSPNPSVTPSPAASTAPAAVCDPGRAPSLIGPDGSQVVLGASNSPSAWVDEDGHEYFLRQVGECAWIVLLGPAEEDQPPFLSAFHGRLGSDFRIVGTFADLTGVRVPGYDNGEFVYRVTFEGSDVVLEEDRTDGGPPGCTGGEGACPEPVVLRRAAP